VNPGDVTAGQGGAARGGQGRNGGNDHRRPDDRHGHNPYVPHGYQTGGNYGVVYGDPFYPFSYGWNPGWYGSGYNNGYNNYTGYNFLDGDNGTTDNGTVTQSTSNEQAQQTTPAAPTVMRGSAVEAQAQVANAVDKSPALVAADGSVTQAESAYNEARERALAALRQQPAYQQALARRHAAARAVHAARATDGTDATPVAEPPSNAVVTAATAKMDAGDEVTKMEAEAVASDPAAASAKARLDQATADRDTLKAQLTAQYQQSNRRG
jgi:hypothetical protein